jgi:hypothetical protein
LATGPYLLVYDAERASGRRLADWVAARDPLGRVVAIPCQNGNLLDLAPELAGRPLERALHGFDLGTRAVHRGSDLLPHLLSRLPGWRWLAPLARIPWLAALLMGRLAR